MKIVGHNEYKITADIYTQLDQEMMLATVDDLADVFNKVNTAALCSLERSKDYSISDIFSCLAISSWVRFSFLLMNKTSKVVFYSTRP